jgi:hypothetical protein
MATKYLKICDGCGKEETIEDGPFGANAQPVGWLVTTAWQGSDKPALTCSWPCLGKHARKLGKDEE